MSIKNILFLLSHEIRQSLKGLLVLQLFLAPLSLLLIVNMIFGQTAIGIPRIGLIDSENSRLVEPIIQNTEVLRYAKEEDIIKELEAKKLDMGIILSDAFDEKVLSKQEGNIKIYIGGESSLQRRLVSFVNLQKGIQNLNKEEPVVNISSKMLGRSDAKPWHVRLFPLIVLIAVLMGGIFIPATSFVEDKQKKTLIALLMAPVNTKEVVWGKMLFGFIISYLMGLLILVLNKNLGNNALAILVVLGLVAMTSSTLGSIIGFVAKDMKSVTTLTQSIMLLLYAPAIINLFPKIPQFLQKLFPTYYLFSPLLKLSSGSFRLSVDGWEIILLTIILMLLQLLLVWVVNKKSENIQFS